MKRKILVIAAVLLEDSIYRACTLLMVGTGTGSELRQPLGYAIVGGLLRRNF
jgi:hypothetical protein